MKGTQCLARPVEGSVLVLGWPVPEFRANAVEGVEDLDGRPRSGGRGDGGCASGVAG